MPEISVIMAAYNTEAFIAAAIASVKRQSFQSWELIVVDDGSRDATFMLASEAAGSDERIKIISRPHSGLGASRNAALMQSRGTYITFLDSDDLLQSWALEYMLHAASCCKAQIVSTPMRSFHGDSAKLFIPAPGQDKADVISGEEATALALYQRQGMDGAVCGKLFEASLWKLQLFREATLYEDLDVFYRVMIAAERVAMLGDSPYLYRQRGGSILHSFSAERADVLGVVERMEEFMQGHSQKLRKAARTRRFAACCNLLLEMRRHGANFPEVREECRFTIRRLRKEVAINNMARLKDRLGALASYFLC